MANANSLLAPCENLVLDANDKLQEVWSLLLQVRDDLPHTEQQTAIGKVMDAIDNLQTALVDVAFHRGTKDN